MEKTIVCLLSINSPKATIDLVEDHSIKTLGSFDLKDISTNICRLCDTNNVYKVRLLGNKNYLSKYIRDIQKEEMLNYNTNKIEIEVD